MVAWITYLVGLLASLSAVSAFAPLTRVLKCMSCHKENGFGQCTGISVCDPSYEVCYVEEEIDVGGETVVSAGCRLKEHCDGFGCFGEGHYRKKRSNYVSVNNYPMPDFVNRSITCHHCCDTDLCNMYGCPGAVDVNSLPGNRCFVCDSVTHPKSCYSARNCGHGESCYIKELFSGTQRRYHLGCMNTRMCDMLAMIHNQSGRKKRRRRFVPVWSDCCKHHMCNGDLPLLAQPPSAHSNTYICPVQGINNAWHTTTEPTTLKSTTPTTLKTTTQSIQTTTTTTTTTEALTSPKTPYTTPYPEPQCRDLLNCQAYGFEYACHGGFDAWAKHNCAKFCGYCTVVSPPPKPKCEDRIDCKPYGFEYACHGGFDAWARHNCAKFCGHC